MKKPLYEFQPDEKCLIQGKTWIVTATKNQIKSNGLLYSEIYLKSSDGTEFVYAPANLIVIKL